jgi:hypothetical protein
VGMGLGLNRCPREVIKHDPVAPIFIFIMYEIETRFHVKGKNPLVIVGVKGQKAASCTIIGYEKELCQIQQQRTNP